MSSNNLLVESSVIDTLNYNCNLLNLFYTNNKHILFYNYFNNFFKTKLTFFFIINKFKQNITSIDRIYSNANWLERESSEMYGINYKWKQDTRKLLLDYIKIESPLLKSYQCEGTQDIFYNIIDNQVVAVKNEVVEL